jgi:hypothetical protein
VNQTDNKVKAFLQKVFIGIESFVVKAGEKGLALLWCGIFSLILLLVFLLSTDARTVLMENEVNKVLEQKGDSKRLGDPIAPWQMDGSAMQLGSWWTVSGSKTIAVAFPVIRDGIFTSFLALIGTNGTIELIPLTKNAAALYERLAPSTIDFYTGRLQRAAEKVFEGKKAKEERGNAR